MVYEEFIVRGGMGIIFLFYRLPMLTESKNTNLFRQDAFSADLVKAMSIDEEQKDAVCIAENISQ